MSFSNGQIPRSALVPVGGGRYLLGESGHAWLALDALSVKINGRHLALSDAYRPLGSPGDYARGVWSQWAAWERYKRGGNLAAYPGTSNHGYGIAVDCGDAYTRSFIDSHGAQFGWSKSWSDAPSEWWHVKYQSGHYHYKPAPFSNHPVLHAGMHGHAVEHLQRLLYAKGYNIKVSGTFGPKTKKYVKKVQRHWGKRADGVVGPATWPVLHKKLKKNRIKKSWKSIQKGK